MNNNYQTINDILIQLDENWVITLSEYIISNRFYKEAATLLTDTYLQQNLINILNELKWELPTKPNALFLIDRIKNISNSHFAKFYTQNLLVNLSSILLEAPDNAINRTETETRDYSRDTDEATNEKRQENNNSTSNGKDITLNTSNTQQNETVKSANSVNNSNHNNNIGQQLTIEQPITIANVNVDMTAQDNKTTDDTTTTNEEQNVENNSSNTDTNKHFGEKYNEDVKRTYQDQDSYFRAWSDVLQKLDVEIWTPLRRHLWREIVYYANV